MQMWIRSPRGGRALSAIALSGVVIFALAIGVLMAPYQAAMGDRISEMTCLQLAFTAERASRLIMSFAPDGQAAMAGLLIPGDLGLAWGYGLLLFGLVGLLARRLDGGWQRAAAIAMWFPIAASVLDCIEDVFLYSMVTQLIASPGAELNAAAPLLAGISATLKYLALSVLTPGFAVAGIVQGLRVDRSSGALVVYALLLLTCYGMVARPLQTVAACF